MLEGLAAWVLNNYLGKYVEDLNTDQLSIAVLSGEVELENLPLRRDALRHLGAPIEVRAGHIGKVRLQIPVRQLRTAPWVIVIERLYLVAGPVPSEDPTGERASAERLAAHDRKLAALDAIEACWRVETDARAAPGYYAASYTSWLSYGTGVITDIVENLQLQVVDVHIRYEDACSASGLVVACGLTVGSLSAHTCDQDWNPGTYTQSADRGDLSFKLLELKDLAVYWDSASVSNASEFLVSDRSANELATAMGPARGPSKYLVAPVSARARLQRNRSDRPLRGNNEPRLVCDLKLDEVPLSIDELQYEQIIVCIRGLELSSRAQKRRALRPSAGPAQQPREWWLYATRRHFPDFRSRVSWGSSLSRARENVRYVQIYSMLLSRPVSAISADDRAVKDNVEWSRDLSELQALREVAMRRTPVEPSAGDRGAARGLGTLVRWFPQWCGWKAAAAAPQADPEGSAREDRGLLEEEILAALADSALDSTVLRRDVVFGRFNFELSSGAVKLCQSSTTMLEFQFTGLCLSLESRPRSASLTVELSLGGICLRDSLTSGTLFPVLVGAPETDRTRVRTVNRTQHTPTTSTGTTAPPTSHSQNNNNKNRKTALNFNAAEPAVAVPLFQLVYGAGPGAEHRLHVQSRPLDVVYQPDAARWLIEFLFAPQQRAAARRRLRDVGVRTRHGLAERWGHVLSGRESADGAHTKGDSRRALWDIRLDVSAPQLILVERFSDPDSAIAVLDFGRLRLRTGGDEEEADAQHTNLSKMTSLENDEEDEDKFMTPCSTPPGSEASAESDTYTTFSTTTQDTLKRGHAPLTTDTLRQRLYETYRVELADIQVLIGRAKDDWRRAHTRGASSLHVLDRFSIALMVERRLVSTDDLTYPSLAVSGTLARLVAHVNEYKIESARALLRMLKNTGAPSPIQADKDDELIMGAQSEMNDNINRNNQGVKDDGNLINGEPYGLKKCEKEQRELDDTFICNSGNNNNNNQIDLKLNIEETNAEVEQQNDRSGFKLHEAENGEKVKATLEPNAAQIKNDLFSPNETVETHIPISQETADDSRQSAQEVACRLVAFRFGVERICLALESRGRCVAELQVSRVVALASSRAADVSATLTVHGLLLVDALQTHGPDFELLAASHPHVGMDSASGSLRDSSEPTSPTSPASPDTSVYNRQQTGPPPAALSRALSGLETWYSAEGGIPAGDEAADALISVEAVWVTAPDPLHLVNVQFNNLDITANQETVVELISFLRRVMPAPTMNGGAPVVPEEAHTVDSQIPAVRTELTCDFHRLTILVLRCISAPDGHTIGKKIATATASGARFHSTTAEDGSTWIRGSLAGLQIVDLTPEAGIHRRIVSAGLDPLSETETDQQERKKREELYNESRDDTALEFNCLERNVNIKIASIWCTYSPTFLSEMSLCIDEFEKYMKLLPRHIQPSKSYQISYDWWTLNYTANLDALSLVVPCSATSDQVVIASVEKVTVRGNNASGRVCKLNASGLNMKIIRVNSDEMKGNRMRRAAVLYGQCVETSLVLHDALLRMCAVWRRADTLPQTDDVNVQEIREVSVNVPGGLRVTLARKQMGLLMDAVARLMEWRGAKAPLLEPVDDFVDGVYNLEIEPEVQARLQCSGCSITPMQTPTRYHFDVPSIDVELLCRSAAVAVTLTSLRVLYASFSDHAEVHSSISYIRAERTDKPSLLFSLQSDRKLIHRHLSRSCPGNVNIYSGTSFSGSLPNRLSQNVVMGDQPRPDEDSSDDGAHDIGDDALKTKWDLFPHRREVAVSVRRMELVLCAEPWSDLLELINLNSNGGQLRTDETNQVMNEWCLDVRAVVVTARRLNREVARLRATSVSLRGSRVAMKRLVRAYVRRLVLTDLTKHGHVLDTRFEVTAAKQAACALDIRYEKSQDSFPRLRVDLAPFIYIHTARFLAEMRAFIADIYPGTNKQGSTALALRIVADSPTVLLPAGPGAKSLLGLTTGRFMLDGELDALTSISCDDMKMYCFHVSEGVRSADRTLILDGGKYVYQDMLLSNQVKLECTMLRQRGNGEGAPGVRVSGRLSALELSLNEEHSRLVGAVIYRNLTDDTSDVYNPYGGCKQEVTLEEERVCLLALRVDVPAVRLRLTDWCLVQLDDVRLLSETRAAGEYSSGVVCARAIVTDGRPVAGKRGKFADVLVASGCGPTVAAAAPQLEVHSRSRYGVSLRHTVLLNGTRVTLLADWWRETLERLTPAPGEKRTGRGAAPAYELRVNATESEIVIVADPDCDESDAVVLRSTTLVTYRAASEVDATRTRTFSSSVNQCSLLWWPTTVDAAPIAGPAAATLELTADGLLETQLLELTARLSCADALALRHIADALLRSIGKPNGGEVGPPSEAERLAAALGFSVLDCTSALLVCNNRADDAALWLTQNARPEINGATPLVRSATVVASRLHVCLVDEAAGAEVPVAEMSLAEVSSRFKEDGTIRLDAIISLDYYNRALSAWEPFLEPWRCELILSHEAPNRYLLNLRSSAVLDLNLTDEVIIVVLSVWYKLLEINPRSKRAAFVPYTLQNETGVEVYMCASLTANDENWDRPQSPPVPAGWCSVPAGGEAAVAFGDEHDWRSRGRANRTRLLWLRPRNWRHTVPPVAVDRTGTFGRRIDRDDANATTVLVMEVRTVPGSARRVVSVRGALVIVNRLPYAVDVKLDPERGVSGAAVSAAGRTATLPARGGRYAVPLPLAHSSAVYARPAVPLEEFAYARVMAGGAGTLSRCATNRGDASWIWCEVRAYGTHRMQEREVHLLAGILLVNLLPQELQYTLGGCEGRVPSGESHAVPQVDPDAALELRVRLDGFCCVQPALIPAALTDQQSHQQQQEGPAAAAIVGPERSDVDELRLMSMLEDERGRRLQVQVRAERCRGARLRLTVAAPYWLVNRTGLPLVFRQQGAGRDAAGQFAEHEVARMRAPLPFSLSEPDAAAAVEVRVGGSGASPQAWCRAFHLRPGEHVRRLAGTDGALYVLGVEVRARRKRSTTVVTVSPRHQLYNGTGLLLELSCWPPQEDTSVVRAPPGCHVPYHHWPGEPRLLCARTSASQWSGAVPVDGAQPAACRLALRALDDDVLVRFLRVEVVPHGAARLVVFSDASTLPPPMRVDNWAAVPISVAQLGVGRAPLVVGDRRRLPYAWDEPTGAARLAVRAPGGAAVICEPENMSRAGLVQHLAYENFIYIAFSREEYTDNCLVMEVEDGGRVVLARKVAGRRAQLWRMTAAGQLQHEGAPAGETRVLDIGAPAPRPSACTPLALRRADPRRRSTQTWRFGMEGRLCCAHRHMCVQAENGRVLPGVVAVLGPERDGLPVVSARRMRPGSGLLAVDVWSDGPTRVVRVLDARELPLTGASPPLAEPRDWTGVAPELWQTPATTERCAVSELRATLALVGGIGVSVVSRGRELLYMRLTDVLAELSSSSERGRSLCVSVRSLQCDNQLADTAQPVVLYVEAATEEALPALELRAETRPSPVPRLVSFRHLVLCTRPLVLNLDEALLLHLYDMWLRHGVSSTDVYEDDEGDELTDDETLSATVVAAAAASATCYHFGVLRVAPGALRLGASTASAAQLSARLRALRRRLGLSLVAFEDAPVQLEAYVRQGALEPGARLAHALRTHYRDELRWQAAAILGSVDFLGAPLGLLGDVRAGVSGMIRERSVGALLAGVAHGLSNSAAKVAETLGDGLGRVALLDEAHEEARRRVLASGAAGATAHLAAGVRGLGFGLLAGATGLFRNAYEGASTDGLQGAVAGLGRGLVGAVAKPVVGVLDLATETARAVRDTSRGAGARAPGPRRIREPRVARCECAGRPLAAYNAQDALGQRHLRTFSRDELFVAYERLYADLRALVSSECMRVLTGGGEGAAPSLVLETPLAELLAWRPHEARGRHYIELAMRSPGGARRPRVRCESAAAARALCRRLALAKRVHDAALYTLRPPP